MKNVQSLFLCWIGVLCSITLILVASQNKTMSELHDTAQHAPVTSSVSPTSQPPNPIVKTTVYPHKACDGTFYFTADEPPGFSLINDKDDQDRNTFWWKPLPGYESVNVTIAVKMADVVEDTCIPSS